MAAATAVDVASMSETAAALNTIAAAAQASSRWLPIILVAAAVVDVAAVREMDSRVEFLFFTRHCSLLGHTTIQLPRCSTGFARIDRPPRLLPRLDRLRLIPTSQCLAP